MDDGEAVARARAGDGEGFRTLVERHGRPLFRLAYRMTGNEHDAEDVVQEALLRAFRRLDQWDERARFSTWLHRIAANCAYDVLRARRRRDETPLPDGSDDVPFAVLPPAPDPPPDRLAASAEIRQRVRVAMSRMSPRERAAFSLRHLQGLSIAEIGEALELDTSAAKQSVLRAVRKVRQVLAATEGAFS